MVITKDRQLNTELIVNNDTIERVNKYKYLGTWVNNNNDVTDEIRCRIETARSAFVKMKSFFCNKDLNLQLRIRLMRCYVFSIYGAEIATFNKLHLKKMEAFEMWMYRRILRVPWTHRETNTNILIRMNKQPELIFTIKKT